MTAGVALHDPAALDSGGYEGHWTVTLDPFTLPAGGDGNIGEFDFAVAIPSGPLVGQLAAFYIGNDGFTNPASNFTAGLTFDSNSPPSWCSYHGVYLVSNVTTWRSFGTSIANTDVEVYDGTFRAVLDGGFAVTADPASDPTWFLAPSPPVVSSVSPACFGFDDIITIRGTNLTPLLRVVFADAHGHSLSLSSGITVISSSEVQVASPGLPWVGLINPVTAVVRTGVGDSAPFGPLVDTSPIQSLVQRLSSGNHTNGSAVIRLDDTAALVLVEEGTGVVDCSIIEVNPIGTPDVLGATWNGAIASRYGCRVSASEAALLSGVFPVGAPTTSQWLNLQLVTRSGAEVITSAVPFSLTAVTGPIVRPWKIIPVSSTIQFVAYVGGGGLMGHGVGYGLGGQSTPRALVACPPSGFLQLADIALIDFDPIAEVAHLLVTYLAYGTGISPAEARAVVVTANTGADSMTVGSPVTLGTYSSSAFIDQEETGRLLPLQRSTALNWLASWLDGMAWPAVPVHVDPSTYALSVSTAIAFGGGGPVPPGLPATTGNFAPHAELVAFSRPSAGDPYFYIAQVYAGPFFPFYAGNPFAGLSSTDVVWAVANNFRGDPDRMIAVVTRSGGTVDVVDLRWIGDVCPTPPPRVRTARASTARLKRIR